MKSAAETWEERVRMRAYHIWEASGRPSGRDEEFWRQACEMIGADDDQPISRVQRPQPKPGQPSQPPRKRGRRSPPPESSVASAPAG
jgi:hypothetical protein